MHFAGDVLSGAIYTRNAEEERPVGHVVADIQLPYTMTQQHKMSPWIKPIESQVPVYHSIDVCSTIRCPEPVTHSLIVPVWLHHEDNPDCKLI